MDTGSTDGTPEIIKERFGDTPGQVITDEPFIDFATTRNRAIELEGLQSVFVLMLSGDEYLRDGKALKEYLEDHREWKNHPKIFKFTSATEMNREIKQQVGAEGEKERNTPESKNGNPGFCFRSSRYHGPYGSGDFLIFGIVRDFQNLIGVILTI